MLIRDEIESEGQHSIFNVSKRTLEKEGVNIFHPTSIITSIWLRGEITTENVRKRGRNE